MDSRTTAIETLRYAWQMNLPGVPPPADNYLGIWVYHDNDNGLALAAIEKTAERNRKRTLENPGAYCWSILKSSITKWCSENPEAVNVAN